MRNWIVASCLSIVSLNLRAQVTDTLGLSQYQSGTAVLYDSPNGGYAFGTNGYHDVAKAQTYQNEATFVLKEVLMIFGNVTFESGDSSSFVRVNVYDNFGSGVLISGPADSIAPDSILSFVDLPVYSLLADGSFTVADFRFDTLVVSAGTRFSVGVDFSGVAQGDTVGLMSTTDGDAVDRYDAWELTSNGYWFVVGQAAYSWGLDVDLAIFPVIDENDPAGVSEHEDFQVSLYPNPCSNQLYFELPSNSNVATVEVFDMSGKQVNLSSVNWSNNSLDVSAIQPGMYFVQLSSKKGFWTERFIKY
ncbi:MAG: T9SS type A sorting domain-containing protein [Flavobacteriales bacterium]|nr:T9SS type A sorting domain-containing protein [Flavobacteriales bacterium]